MTGTASRRVFLAGAGVVGAGLVASSVTSCSQDDRSIGAPTAARAAAVRTASSRSTAARITAARSGPFDVAIVDDDRLLAVAPDGTRLRRAGTGRGVEASTGGAVRWMLGERPGASLTIDHVDGAAVASDGSFWIADPTARRVLHVTAAGAVDRTLGAPMGPGAFSRPVDVAVRADGAVAVADTTGVVVFGPDGSARGRIAEQGRGRNDLRGALAVEWLGNDIAVLDPSGRVVVFGVDGTRRRTVALPDGTHPSGMAAVDGALFVGAMDGSVHRIAAGTVSSVTGLGGHVVSVHDGGSDGVVVARRLVPDGVLA